jgi:hypothetical protein
MTHPNANVNPTTTEGDAMDRKPIDRPADGVPGESAAAAGREHEAGSPATRLGPGPGADMSASEARLLESSRRVEALFVRAFAEIMARDRAVAKGEPRAAGADLDALAAQIKAEAARARRATRELILRGRREVGDEKWRRVITELLVRDGFSRARAAACARRIHAAPVPADKDVTRVMGAYLRLRHGAEGVPGPAGGTKAQAKGKVKAAIASLLDCLSRFEAETGLGGGAVPDAGYAEAWQRWMAAQQPRG